MRIPLKHSNKKWIPYQEDIELLIDYPTVDQQEELEIIKYDVEQELTEVAELSLKLTKKKSNAIAKQLDHKVRNPKLLKFFRTYIACSVKDWKNIIDTQTSQAIKCEIEDDKLNKESLWLLAQYPYDVLSLYSAIIKENEFTNLDKKKSNSANF